LGLLHIFVLAVVQGITEFLPISSSGHLILVPVLTDWPDQGILIDVAVHVGTLGAVMFYFRRDVAGLFRAIWQLLTFNHHKNEEQGLFWALVVATVPVVIVGGILSLSGWNDMLRSAEVIGWASIIFGLLLYVVDLKSPQKDDLGQVTLRQAVWLGLAQVLALIPGTSRSGITMTAARGMGFSRVAAARFSMLMSIPTILAAGLIEGAKLYHSGSVTLGMDALFSATLAFFAALLAIAGLMAWLKRASMAPFVWYRVALGIGLLCWVYL